VSQPLPVVAPGAVGLGLRPDGRVGERMRKSGEAMLVVTIACGARGGPASPAGAR
jgi:hypothetical protein